MKIAALVLNENGFQIASTISSQLGAIDIFIPEYLGEKFSQVQKFSSLKKCVRRLFGAYQGLIFVMATGIVVRTISPYIKDKHSDPAIVVIDREGRYAISLLGGHSAGANELARKVAMAIGAKVVITTAVDSDFVDSTTKVAAGIGCRQGVTKQEIKQALNEALKLVDLSRSHLYKLASISLKKKEAALCAVASELKIPLGFYTRDELGKVSFPSSSTFVKTKVGVESVCEPAAILVAGKGKLILPKTKFGRVTVALAKVELQ